MTKQLFGRWQSLLFWLFLLSSTQAAAWGYDGHRVIGEIAWHYLQPKVRTQVKEFLQRAQEPSLAEGATWADRIRSESRYDWAAPLHYISLPYRWKNYRESRDCPQTGCILKAIGQFSQVLSDRNIPQKERAEALLFLAHFVGDIHQPLHTGLASDRGGNDISVEFFGYPTNLHTLWDVYLPAGFVYDWRQYAAEQPKAITESERNRWLNGKPQDWAAESHRLAHSQAYTKAVKLGADYYHNNQPTIELRLRQGGVRLADLLNQLLGEVDQ